MAMRVVCVRYMRMFMNQRLMMMYMAVGSNRHGVVGMQVMPVVVRVRMFMLLRNMAVHVGVAFRQVQHDANDHEERTRQQKR